MGDVLHNLQNGLGPGIVMLQERVCLLLWPESGSSSLQLSQHHNVAVRADSLSVFQEIQKDQPLPIKMTGHITLSVMGCVLYFFSDGEFIIIESSS